MKYIFKITLHASIFNTLCFEQCTKTSWGLYLGLVIIFKLMYEYIVMMNPEHKNDATLFSKIYCNI